MNISKSTPRPHGNSNFAKNGGFNNDNDNRIEIEGSNKYYGQRDKFENWFIQMELFFGFQKKTFPITKKSYSQSFICGIKF